MRGSGRPRGSLPPGVSTSLTVDMCIRRSNFFLREHRRCPRQTRCVRTHAMKRKGANFHRQAVLICNTEALANGLGFPEDILPLLTLQHIQNKVSLCCVGATPLYCHAVSRQSRFFIPVMKTAVGRFLSDSLRLQGHHICDVYCTVDQGRVIGIHVQIQLPIGQQ